MKVFTTKVDISYAVLAMPLSLLGIPLYLYLPLYLYENWQISLSLIGVILLATRLTDVVTDPLVGFLSDRFQNQISRLQQIAIGCVLLVLGSYFLFVPIDSWLTAAPVVYLLVFLFISFLGWTLIVVPYQALVAELTEDRNLKTRLTSFREGFVVLGVLTALTLPFVLSLAPTSQSLFEIFWWLLVVSILIGILLLKFNVTSQLMVFAKNHQSPKALMILIWTKHRWALKLMPAYFLNNLANAFPATLFLIFVGYGLGMEAEAGIFLMVYFISGVLALPAWFYLSKHIGKDQAWLVSMLLASICFTGVFALETGDFYGYLAICILTGLSLGADIALPASLQADIAQKLSQQLENVNGILFGLWGLLTKLALAIAVGLALPVLEGLGLDQSTEESHQMLWIFYAGIPIGLKFIAVYLLRRFSRADSILGN